tara:strand:+ start:551 stop:1135 length:585 start_codon:yes stop_codon:yes gene_type:complete
MALPSSGVLSIGDIAGEFGGAAPHALSEYYGAAAGVPASGTIAISDFYGTSSVIDPAYTQVNNNATGWSESPAGALTTASSQTACRGVGGAKIGGTGSIWQTFSITAGVVYKATGQTLKPSGSSDTRYLRVYDGSGTSGTQLGAATLSTTITSWWPFSFTFTPTTSTVTFAFWISASAGTTRISPIKDTIVEVN